MATKRTHNKVDSNTNENCGAIIDVSISRKKFKKYIFVGTVVVFVVLVLLLIFFSYQVANFSQKVDDLRTYKDKQNNIARLIEEKCGDMLSSATSYDDGYNKTACLDAVDDGKEYGVIGEYCSYSISITKNKDQSDDLPSKGSGCDDVATRISAVEKNIADERYEEEAHDAIFVACNSIAKLSSANCVDTEARYGNKWKAVICGGYVYQPPSSAVKNGVFHYYEGLYTPNPSGQCYW
jgi:cell division protein FtsL